MSFHTTCPAITTIDGGGAYSPTATVSVLLFYGACQERKWERDYAACNLHLQHYPAYQRKAISEQVQGAETRETCNDIASVVGRDY